MANARGLCAGNAGRSIMADALIHTRGEGACVAKSAGSKVAGSEAEFNTAFEEVFNLLKNRLEKQPL